ncbi:MAG TPA: phenylalanine--tRNA ligase subunit beta, partial [Candidatus Cloacimonadota bacterium]|nr:phenylalanine--tRNA ligase subunit beta [Candidatus Cloacimonadota bacterium]
MKLSLSWLQKYIDIHEDAQTLAELLTFAGIEVEDIQRLDALPETVVTARVVSAEKVPDTDHLQQCLIDLGDYPHPEKDADGLLQVICGAPNCHSGMMVVIALPGTVLGDLQIKKAKIRGVVSNGMLCSERELGISENHAGIIELLQDTVPGISVNEALELPDVVYELEITPNRSDLLGYIGIARDLSAKLDRELHLPVISEHSATSANMKLGLHNHEPELCPRYTARVIKGVKVAQSPQWLRNALVKNGLRSINNIVDITNFVLLETGHPLHAFDFDKLAGKDKGYPDIIVRKAYPQENFLALDGKTYQLDGDELVIADGEKASALAGIMGGEGSAITDKTTNIVLESAAFHPGSIR